MTHEGDLKLKVSQNIQTILTQYTPETILGEGCPLKRGRGQGRR